MEMNMSIAGVKSASAPRNENLIVERLRTANARLQMEANAANRKLAAIQNAAAELKSLKDELAQAKKTIADLNARIKSISAKAEKKAKIEKYEKAEKVEKTEE